MKTMVVRACALGFLLSGCGIDGSGELVTEEHVIADAHVLEIESGLEVVLTRSAEPRLSVTADDNLVDLLVIQEGEGSLRLAMPQTVGDIRPSEPIHIELAVSDLTELKVSDGVRVEVTGLGENVALALSDGSEVVFDRLWGNHLDADLSDASTLRVESLEVATWDLAMSDSSRSLVTAGSVDALISAQSDASSLVATELEVASSELALSDSSSVQIGDAGAIFGALSGASWVKYAGDAYIGDLDVCEDCMVSRTDAE
ncbi:MAG TPA: DUF2807 domain-containing protein [Polyangiaceae bacterium]|nr:DUF2807 domain-containing protein [Polyangiaceae bacterium]